MNKKKIKVLLLGDSCIAKSGVGTQLLYIVDALIKSGKFTVFQMAGAIRHQNYNAIKTEEYGDSLIIQPVDNFGSPDQIRSILRTEKPDILLFQSDPRFFGWLWNIENEIRPHIPVIYFHVWDSKPYPTFNRPFYVSNDKIVTISKLTQDIVETVSPEIASEYLPHAVDPNIFKKMSAGDKMTAKINILGEKNKNKFVFFFNSRNARRKQSGSIIFWFKDFLDIVGKDKAMLVLKSDPYDENGQNLYEIVKFLNIENGEVSFIREMISSQNIAALYNISDVTLNLSDAEGFGLSVQESLACETPVIGTMTGGIQEQIFDGKKYFGVGLKPASRAIIGSQQIPWIYEDRVSGDDAVAAMIKMFEMSQSDRNELGKLAKQHVEKNYNFEKYQNRWVEIMLELHEKHGSWQTRKNYNSWEMAEI